MSQPRVDLNKYRFTGHNGSGDNKASSGSSSSIASESSKDKKNIVIQETPELKPKRKRVMAYHDLPETDEETINKNNETISGDDDELLLSPSSPVLNRQKKKRVRLFDDEDSEDDIQQPIEDELSTFTNGHQEPLNDGTHLFRKALIQLSQRLPTYDSDVLKNVLESVDGDVTKAVRFLQQEKAKDFLSKSPDHKPSTSKSGWISVLNKPDKDFIANNHKIPMVKKPSNILLSSDSEDEVQVLPAGRKTLPTKTCSFFSTPSTLKPSDVPKKLLKEKTPKQKRRFVVLDNDDSKDSFINDDSDGSSRDGDDRHKKTKKPKGGGKKKRRDPEEDELIEILSGSEEDEHYEKDRIVFTSDEEEEDDDDDEDDTPVKRKSKKVPKRHTEERQGSLKDRVLNFMEKASLMDLLSIPGISKKKAQQIMAMRPFANFTDLKLKVQSSKGISTEVINASLETIKSRDVVKKLMTDCEELSNQISETVSELREARQPSILNPNCELKQYQMIGLNWLVLMHQKGINAILADEMGLGKTIQVIALLAHIRENFNIKGPHMIVVPSSTLDNWDREMSLWCPKLDVLVYHGSQAERMDLREQVVRGELSFDVILTTYNMVFSEEDKNFFKRYQFAYIVFDEAHMLKNMKSARYGKLFKLKAQHRLMLTGTPLQNNLLELMSLLIFTVPNLFSARTDDIKKMFDFTSTRGVNGEISTFEEQRISHAKKIMQPFILRRLKDDVLKQLPKKTIIIKKCPMTSSQMRKYNRLIHSYQEEIKKDDSIIETCDDFGENDLEDMKKTKKNAGGAMLMNLRKAANHPLLIRQNYTTAKLLDMSRLILKEPQYATDGNQQYIFEDMEWYSDFELHSLCLKFPSIRSFKLSDEKLLDSGKFKILDELLPKLQEEKRKVLLFSQFTMTLDIIEKYMDIRGHKFMRLDGSTKTTDRLDLIDEFNSQSSDIFIFLLTTRAGGVGINLTSATVAIIHDIDFNPYNDKQAEDRCHRVGQTREVTIYKFVSEDTIEEGILRMADNKLKLGDDLCIGSNGSKGNRDEGHQKDMRTLLKQCLAFG